MTREEILAAIAGALRGVAPEVARVDESTPLLGQGAVVDSVGFVTLLVTVEQGLPSPIDLAAAFMKHVEGPEESNPFRTVGSLALHLHDALAAQV